MTREIKLAVEEELLTGIVCSQAWSQEQLNDPEIVKNAAQLANVIHSVSEHVP